MDDKRKIEDAKEDSKTNKKGRRFSKTRKSNKNRSSGTTDTNPRTNDVSWYASDPTILRNAANFSFNNPLGNTLRVSELTQLGSYVTFSNIDVLDKSIPGIMRLNYIPTIGYSKDKTSQVNIAARSIYSAVRAGLSGNWKNYEPADLMKYIMAVDSMYALHAYLIRIYGLARIYAQQNRYWPKAILESMGIDVDDLIANLSDFRYYINTLAVRINSLSVPKDMNIFNRHYMLNATVWKDGGAVKSQMYYFAPVYLYQYDEMNQPNGVAALVPFEMPTSSERFKVSQLYDICENLILPLLGSEDIGVISGDLIKVCGEAGLAKLPIIDVDFTVEPNFDMVVLHQIHNMIFVGAEAELASNKDSFKITELTTQDGQAGALVQTPILNQTITGSKGKDVNSVIVSFAKLVDVHGLDEVPPEIVMEITRMLVSGKIVVQDNIVQTIIDGFGTEIPTTYEVISLNPDGTLKIFKGDSITNSFENVATAGWTQAIQFDYAPIQLAVKPTMAAGDSTVLVQAQATGGSPYYADLENYTVLSNADVKKLHDCALLGLFNVPTYGTYMSGKLK